MAHISIEDALNYTKETLDFLKGYSIDNPLRKAYYQYIIKYPEEMDYIDHFSDYSDCALDEDYIYKYIYYALQQGKKVANYVFFYEDSEGNWDEEQSLILVPENTIYYFRPDYYDDEKGPEDNNALLLAKKEYFLDEINEINKIELSRAKEERKYTADYVMDKIFAIKENWLASGMMLSDELIKKDLPPVTEPLIIP